MMALKYHKADEFRFNLHAFIQALREVTFMLQNDKSKIPDFEKWYEKMQEKMKANSCLLRIKNTRTLIVHQQSLKAKSKIEVGLYRGRNLKFGFTFNNINPFYDSKEIFDKIMPEIIAMGFIDKGHSALDEQLGIRREWHCDELGDGEILSICYDAYLCICEIMVEAHSKLGLELVPQGLPDDFLNGVYTLLESDLDPTLPKKWGWCD